MPKHWVLARTIMRPASGAQGREKSKRYFNKTRASFILCSQNQNISRSLNYDLEVLVINELKLAKYEGAL